MNSAAEAEPGDLAIGSADQLAASLTKRRIEADQAVLGVEAQSDERRHGFG